MLRDSPVFALLLLGCGPGEVIEHDPELVFPEEPRCLSCDLPPSEPTQESFEATPDVRVSPEELLFYPIHGAATEYDPSSVTVENHLDLVVYVTLTRVVDDTSAGVQTGGADYFLVDPIETWIELETEGEAELLVWFSGSEKQQSATLEILTTAYPYRRLNVSLTGKTIIQ